MWIVLEKRNEDLFLGTVYTKKNVSENGMKLVTLTCVIILCINIFEVTLFFE
jgi:hypothetical protein